MTLPRGLPTRSELESELSKSQVAFAEASLQLLTLTTQLEELKYANYERTTKIAALQHEVAHLKTGRVTSDYLTTGIRYSSSTYREEALFKEKETLAKQNQCLTAKNQALAQENETLTAQNVNSFNQIAELEWKVKDLEQALSPSPPTPPKQQSSPRRRSMTAPAHSYDRIPAPVYSRVCWYQRCRRLRCPYVHQNQREIHADLIRTLPVGPGGEGEL